MHRCIVVRDVLLVNYSQIYAKKQILECLIVRKKTDRPSAASVAGHKDLFFEAHFHQNNRVSGGF